MNAPAVFLEAVAALSLASGHLRELDRADVAHRCDAAAARLQLLIEEEDELAAEECESLE